MRYKVSISWVCDQVTDYNFSIDSTVFVVDDLVEFLPSLPKVVSQVKGTVLNIQVIKID